MLIRCLVTTVPALYSGVSLRKGAESLLLSGHEPWSNELGPVVEPEL